MTDSALDEDRTASDFDDDFEPFDIEGAPELPAERYLDRELSWLAFNQRVLELAEDPAHPGARAGELPGDLRLATSTSSSWCGSPG